MFERRLNCCGVETGYWGLGRIESGDVMVEQLHRTPGIFMAVGKRRAVVAAWARLF